MWRRKMAESGHGADLLYPKLNRRCDPMQGGTRAVRVLIAFGSRLAGFVILCTLVFACCAQDISRAQTSGEVADQPSDAERAAYADALAFCRGNSPRPEAFQGAVTLRTDKQVLCFDGWMLSESDFLLANGLQHGGIFVVRSQGGDAAATIALADLLLLKDATVVIKDYCLQACADYLFMATAKTFVPKDAIVAWTFELSDTNDCLKFSKSGDLREPDKAAQCGGSLVPRDDKLRREFYRDRIVVPPEPSPKGVAVRSIPTPTSSPKSVVIRRILKRRFDEIGRYPSNTYWTWNPRYYASTIKTKIFYEAYPQSQDEVDAIVKRLGLAISVIYDP